MSCRVIESGFRHSSQRVLGDRCRWNFVFFSAWFFAVVSMGFLFRDAWRFTASSNKYAISFCFHTAFHINFPRFRGLMRLLYNRTAAGAQNRFEEMLSWRRKREQPTGNGWGGGLVSSDFSVSGWMYDRSLRIRNHYVMSSDCFPVTISVTLFHIRKILALKGSGLLLMQRPLLRMLSTWLVVQLSSAQILGQEMNFILADQ